jgi:Tol biopolymer transport system component
VKTLPVKIVLLIGALFLLALPVAAAAPPPPPFDWWPVPSPDGTRVAFTRVFTGLGTHMTVEVVDLKTKRVSVIASSQGQLDPTWSQDGSQLAYSAGGVLRISNPTGTNKRRYVAPMRAFAPAWRPNSTQLAYLTSHGAQNTDLWVAGALWARDVIGRPAWSPDGSAIAYQRDNGIYVASGPGVERQVASIDNPGPPSWSADGKTVAYGAGKGMYTVPADASAPPTLVVRGLGEVGKPAWRFDGARLAAAYLRGVSVVPLTGGVAVKVAGASGPDAAYLPGSTILLITGSVKGCGSRAGIAEVIGGTLHQLTNCVPAPK